MGKLKCIIALILFCSVAFAQTDGQSVSQKINEIKMQPDTYFSAESTCQTWEEALSNAKFLLGVEIENWAKANKKGDAEGFVAFAQQHLLELKAMRGNLYRAFVYVRKSDIVSIPKEAAQPVCVDEEITKEEVREKEEQPVVREVEPKVEPKVEPRVEPKVEPRVAKPVQTVVSETRQLTPLEQRMIKVQNGSELELFIKNPENSNKILQYGRYSQMPAGTDCYLFVYNKEHSVVAYLHKVGEVYYNVISGEKVSMTSYKGMGAIWFQIK